MICRDIDELGGGFALGAVPAHEHRMIEDHLLACAEPHADLRAALGVGAVLAAAVEPISPSPALRDRLMASLEAAPQEHVASEPRRVPREVRPERSGGFWSPGWLRGLAMGGVAASLVLAVAVGALWTQLGERERQLQTAVAAIAGGQAVHRIESETATGYLVETASGATLVLADVAALPADRLYELWLIDAGGTPVDVGTFRPSDDDLAIVALERGTEGFATFAVTIETARVAAPTGEPVIATPLEG